MEYFVNFIYLYINFLNKDNKLYFAFKSQNFKNKSRKNVHGLQFVQDERHRDRIAQVRRFFKTSSEDLELRISQKLKKK